MGFLFLVAACNTAPLAGAPRYYAGYAVDAVNVNPQMMLAAHNRVRSRVGVPPLRWSPKLARYAQDWANSLASHYQCQMIHRVEVGTDYGRHGENLFWASALVWPDGYRLAQYVDDTMIADSWARPGQYYNYRYNQCQTGQECGHYTQMVWRDTREVGCAMALCPDLGQVWVCNYDPPGNYEGVRPY